MGAGVGVAKLDFLFSIGLVPLDSISSTVFRNAPHGMKFCGAAVDARGLLAAIVSNESESICWS